MKFLYLWLLLLLGSQWPKLVHSAGLCGNGVVNSPEECDDGNLISEDGCDNECIIEPYYRCDSSSPNICKIDSKISFALLGNRRITSGNTVIIKLGFYLHLAVFNKISFPSLFTTTIPSSKTSLDFNYNTNILTATIDYTSNIENTDQSFQLTLSSTPYFWYDSTRLNVQLNGGNCQLTYQEDLWIHNIMVYVVVGLVAVMFMIGVSSIFFEKMIGLELIQTFQSVYFLMLLLKEYPYEFTSLNEGLRYANGFDDVIAPDYNRTYPLPNELNALMIEKEFPINFNIDMGLLGLNAIILAALALRKARLKYSQQSEINRELKKSHERLSRYSTFMFGEVFIMLVLVFMFKILVVFIVQLSSKTSKTNLFSDNVNIVLSLFSFLILISIIVYIINWYIMTPDTLGEGETFLSLRFRNMRFYYPVLYLIYQILHIAVIVIYYVYDVAVYAVLALQLAYFALIIWLWPYNTTRKINRILHNFTLLHNQLVSILFTCIIIRWRTIIGGSSQISSGFQFTTYCFLILLMLVVSAVLAVMRMLIFDKDVQCCQTADEGLQENNEELKTFRREDLAKIISHERETSGKEHLLQHQMRPSKPKRSGSGEDDQIFSKYGIMQDNELVGRFLNVQYVHWSKTASEDIRQSKSSARMKNIRRTISKLAELIKSPLQEYAELRNNHRAAIDSVQDNDQDHINLP